jgi:hypothetical protein
MRRALAILRVQARALGLDVQNPPLETRAAHLTIFGLHLLALLAVARLAHWPLWLAPAMVALAGLPSLARHRWLSQVMAPFAVLYGAAALRLVLVNGLRQTAPPALDYTWALGFSAAWALLVAMQAVGRLRWAAVLAAAGGAGLMLNLLWGYAAAGVTGSDPYAYVQMALDLVQHGTVLHSFPLAVFAGGLGLPTLPATHVGYVLANAQGLAPTVWPPGYSVLLAGADWLGGERLVLTFNSWVGLAGLVLTTAVTVLVAPREQRRWGLVAGLVAAALVATSSELLTRLVTPLADGATLVLTGLTVAILLLALRARGRRVSFYSMLGALAGLSLAAAYSVRYTQVLVAPGIVLAAWFGLKERKARLAFLLVFAAVAAAGAVPDLLYRLRLYGTPFRFGTGELALFSLQALPAAVRQLGAEALDPREFGWLWPLVVLGALYAWRHARGPLLAVLASYGPLLLFHLWYPFVRLRDVLSLYVPLAAYAALGGLALLTWIWRRTPKPEGVSDGFVSDWGTLARAGAVAGVLVLAVIRLGPVIGFDSGFFTFGYLLPQQRRSIETIAALSEPQAVIACSLNSGAVELYSGRQTVRPGSLLQPGSSWSLDQWLTMANALQAAGRPVYLLMDSPEMAAPLKAIEASHAVQQVGDIELPVFFVGGGSLNETVPLYKVMGK